MRVSLRVRIVLFLALLNAGLFAAGSWFFSQELDRARGFYAGRSQDLLAKSLAPTILPGSDLSVAPILAWPNWKNFPDALVVRASWDRGPDGEIRPSGAFLNPLGRARRSPSFDQQAVLRNIVLAVESGSTLEGQGGLAAPIFDSTGAVWGGLWLSFDRGGRADLAPRFVGVFLIVLCVLTLGTFYVLRRFVLEPVETLARGAQAVAAGDLSVRVSEPARRDELADLVRGFNAMTATVQGFNARLANEVELATEQARRAEAAAMTQRRLAAMGELAAGIAHEINNPLGGLINAAHMLETSALAPDKREQYFALLKSGLERIQATAGRLLRFTPRSGPPQPASLARAIDDAAALVAHRASSQRVEIVFLCDDPTRVERALVLERWQALPNVLGRESELAQALLNLLVNALDALEERGRGRIEIGLVRKADELVLSVRDDGPGVNPADLPRIADLFYTTKEVGRGTGLGLSIVHRVVAEHFGTVWLANRPNGGFSIEIRLPVHATARNPHSGEERA